MQTQNIAFGFNLDVVGQVKVGAYGAGEGAGVNTGRTKAGIELSFEREMKLIENDQDKGPIASKEISRVGKLKLSFAEASLENLAVALNLPTTAVSGGVLSLSAPASGEAYSEIYLYTDGVAGGKRKYFLPKCSISGNGAHSYKKDDKTIIVLELDVLWDSTQAVGAEQGTVTDTGGDTTPPTVALSTPVDGGTVTKDAKGVVVWTITEANAIDQSTIGYGNTFSIFNITTAGTSSLVGGSITYDATAKTVTFTPTANWTASDDLQASVTTGLKDENGNALATAVVEQFSVTA